MHTSASVVVRAAPGVVYPLVFDLARYPEWLPLVHRAVVAPDAVGAQHPAWLVEVRARVGPFARSKQLRMERAVAVPNRSARFERAETDGRNHARWALGVDLDEVDRPIEPDVEHTRVTMHLAYEGSLWTGGLLERVLDDEIRRARDGLRRAVAVETA